MMKLADVKQKARQLGIANPSSDRTDLIRQIQSYEGYTPCFRTKEKCAEKGCSWYAECLRR